MIEDAELLRRYIQDKSEDAFAELVRRRVDLVYSVALRQVGFDAHLAEDVTQKVFTALARKAGRLPSGTVVSGWLYRAAQFAASDVVRSERRRRAREQETYAMQQTHGTSEGDAEWTQIRPLLDQAMSELNDDDRGAVALRFFEGLPFAEIGRALRLDEEAARKRVDRALDKIAAALARRGVTSTAAALGTALVSQTMVAAPAGLAASVTGTALAGVGVGAGLLAFVSSTKFALGLGAATLVSAGTAVYHYEEALERSAELGTAMKNHVVAQTRVAELEERLRTTEKRAVAAEDDSGRLLAAIDRLTTGRIPGSEPSSFSGDAAIQAQPMQPVPVTRETIEARYRRAQQLARSGDPVEALSELLWCYDVGMPQVSSYSGVRVSFLLGDIARLAERYPPALEALRQRRDAVAQRLSSRGADHKEYFEFASLNRALNESDLTLGVFDQLPAGDRRRTALASLLFDELLQQKRYNEASEGRSFAQSVEQFERSLNHSLPSNTPNLERIMQSRRDLAVKTAGKSIEVLAGSGNLEQARRLAGTVLASSNSAVTRALLQSHVERAGQPHLLADVIDAK